MPIKNERAVGPEFRALRPDEIRVRLVDVTEGGAKVLLYPKADAVRAILTEAVGPWNWKCSHTCLGRDIYCSIGLRPNETADFVYRDAAGNASYTEPGKGADADSFCKAALVWGVGAELLTLPKMMLGGDKLTITPAMSPDNKRVMGYQVRDVLHVADISIADEDGGKVIVALALENQSGRKILWQRQPGA